MPYIDIFASLGAALVGLLIGLFVIAQKRFNEHELLAKAEKAKASAEKEGKTLVAETRERVIHKKKQFEIEEQEFAGQLEKMEHLFTIKIASHEKREAKLAELKRALQEEEKSVETFRSQIHEFKKQIAERLIHATGLSADHIKEEVTKHNEQFFQKDAEVRLQHAVEWAEECAVRYGKNVLADAIYRYAAPTSVEHGGGDIKISRDELKGRIIGRGGANIAHFEELFGVDVIFNDEPNIIIVSSFNLVSRQIAIAALERLMREKNITEEIIDRIKPLAEEDVAKILKTDGERVLKILGVENMPPDFAILVGRLKFRTSYGQNILGHSFEVGYFAQLMASDIGADPRVALLGGFFHDIGKAIDQEVGGSHDVLSKEILEKYGFSWEIVHAAWTHHNAIPQETVEARIVQAADAISAGRPGARAESVERYLAKIKELEETALSFGGVRKAFTINAGREVRVVVESDKINDAGVQTLAADIAAKVQEKGGYPGKIKVVTIRSTKATDYAR